MGSLTYDVREKERQLTVIFCLAEHCVLGNLHYEMIRDRLVAGLLDDALSEEMQLNPRESCDYGPPKRGSPPTASIVRGTAQESSDPFDLEALNSREHSKCTVKSEKAADRKC